MTDRKRAWGRRRAGGGPSRTEHAEGGRTRRAAEAAVGGTLLVAGLRRRSVEGVAAAAAGGWLLAGAVDGPDRVRRAIRERTSIDREGVTRDGEVGATEARRSVTVGKPPEELYEIWRDPDRLTRIVGSFAEISSAHGDRIRWTVDGPRGREIAWETSYVEAEPGETLRWETPPDAMVPNEGTLSFRPAPGDRGTVVTLSVGFDPPGGTLGNAAFKRLDVVPEALVGRALTRFKSLAETGEIPTLEGNPSGRGEGDLL